MIFLKQDIQYILESEIRDIFNERFGGYAFGETINETKYYLAQVGEYLYNNTSPENTLNIVLGDYLYYLRQHFLNLWELYDKLKEQNSNIYLRFIQKGYDAFDLFVRIGFICMFAMDDETQKAILIDKKYELFWSEFYQIIDQMTMEFLKERFGTTQKMVSEFLAIQGISDLTKFKWTKRPEGRPSVVTWDILMKFAEILEENRKEKKYTLNKMLEMATEGKIDPTTLRNWVRNHMPLLPEKRNSINELTIEDFKYMWNEYQKVKKI